MARTPYPSDLTDKQWQLIERMIPSAEPGGRPRSVDMREVFNGILYLLRTGCSWRQLPHDLPPWGTVHYDYCRFRLNGTWQRIHDKLREKVRRKVGRKPTPSAAIIDSQSVKSHHQGGAWLRRGQENPWPKAFCDRGHARLGDGRDGAPC